MVGLVAGIGLRALIAASQGPDVQPYIAQGCLLVDQFNLNHAQVAASTDAQISTYCRTDANVPIPRTVTFGAVRAGIYRYSLQRDANADRAAWKAAIDAFAASKGGGAEWTVVATDLKARVDAFGPDKLFPGDAQ
jgi:hypothetical protein